MSIANPTTYAEWYWAQQVDADKTYKDAQETVLAPYLQPILDTLSEIQDFPTALIAPLLHLGEAGHFGVADVAVGVSAETAHSGILAGISPLLRMVGYNANTHFQTNFITANQAALLASRHKAIPEFWLSRAHAEGYGLNEAGALYNTILPFPDPERLCQWARYVTDGDETFSKFQSKQDIPDDEFQIWDFMTQLHLSASEIQQLYVRKYMDISSAKLELRRDGWRDFDADAVLDLGYTIPNPTYLIQAAVLADKRGQDLIDAITIAGIHPDFAQAYIDANLAKPNPSDVIRWRLRHDPNLTELETDLRKLGVHPDYIDVFRELSYPVPPIGDMITMAVREAFTPDIASRFGQYEDYPSDLTKYAQMNGISEDWTRRYWAAHWTLPSPQQGFAMYQRGIIDEDTLHLLLRALDIMPFWRDRLTQLAYNPLTRIDVRRMYYVGSLTAEEVEKAYKDAGYSPDNARRLRDFVVRDTIRSQSGMSVTKIVTAYKSGYSTRQEAVNDIERIGIRSDAVSDILERADRQLSWQRVKDGIAGIANEYKKEVITEETARAQLYAIGQDGTKINALIAKWDKDRKDEHKLLWTKADTLSLLKKKLITQARAGQELSSLGYNTERANALITLALQA